MPWLLARRDNKRNRKLLMQLELCEVYFRFTQFYTPYVVGHTIYYTYGGAKPGLWLDAPCEIWMCSRGSGQRSFLISAMP